MDKIRYLNVDCTLTSSSNLTEFLSHLDGEVFILWNEHNENSYSIGIETNLIDSSSPNEDLSKFLNLFENLPKLQLSLLKKCDEKIFDIGFESGNSDQVFDTSLDTKLIERVANLGFSINIRIYPHYQK